MSGDNAAPEKGPSSSFKLPESADEATAQLRSLASTAASKLRGLGSVVQERHAEVREAIESRRQQQLADVPSELRSRRQLQIAAEDVTIAAVSGLAVGAAISLVFLRRSGSRLMFTGFGAGVGVGSAWTDVSEHFSLKAISAPQEKN